MVSFSRKEKELPWGALLLLSPQAWGEYLVSFGSQRESPKHLLSPKYRESHCGSFPDTL